MNEVADREASGTGSTSFLEQVQTGDEVLLFGNNDSRYIQGVVRKLLKKSISILTSEGFVEFVEYADIDIWEIKGSSQSDIDAKPSLENQIITSPRQKPKRGLSPKLDITPVILDIETTDPDDILTLMFAACHPRVDLRAVTVTPGSEDQLILVQHVLSHMNAAENVRLGAQAWPNNRRKMGCANLQFYSKFLHPSSHLKHGRSKSKKPSNQKIQGSIDPDSVFPAAELIQKISLECENLSIFTGGPLHNLAAALRLGACLPRWVGQGGFCGEGVVPKEVPVLPKFAGCTHVNTWNFGGGVEATMTALQSQQITRKVLVGKNVCHRCKYDSLIDQRLQSYVRESSSKPHQKAIQWIQHAMSCQYSNKKLKKLHDPLAFATLLDEGVCTLREVEVQVQDGKWGAVLSEGTAIWAAVDYDTDMFISAVME
mmetsp:Transcript_4640/g.7191  ORF Transcript_4640/g.7191 Transcript_4640/m.7191 type:complete len:428 (+) Transcript_4640:53-1336(+)